MTEDIWQSIAATPWWLYLFFGYIIWICYCATKPRLITTKQLMMLPFCLICLCLFSVTAAHAVTIPHLSYWILALFLGTGLGYLHYRFRQIKAVKNINALQLPGSWVPFIMFALVFAGKFYFGNSFTISPQMLIDPHYSYIFIFAYGLLTGIATGQLSYALRCLKYGPYTLPSPSSIN